MGLLKKAVKSVKNTLKDPVRAGIMLTGAAAGGGFGATLGYAAGKGIQSYYKNKYGGSDNGGGGGGGGEEGSDYGAILQQQIELANSYTQQGTASAPKLDEYANKVSGIGDSMSVYEDKFNAQAAALDPYIRDYNQYADTLWNQGLGIFGTGTGLSRQGTGLMAMDGSNDPDSLAGRYESWVRQIDPDRYVSMAAQDVQKSYDNTLQQQVRAMGRMGYDASSTKTAEFQQRMHQSLAAALAGAKTRARQQGMSDMGAALSSALDQAKSLISGGTQIQQTGAALEQAGAGLRGDAAKLETSKASLYAMAADAEKTRASLYTAASNITAQKAQIYNNAASAVMGGAQAAVGAMNVDLGYYKADLSYQLGQQQIQAEKEAAMMEMFGNIAGAGLGTLAKLA